MLNLYDKIELLLQLKDKTFHFRVRGQLLSTSQVLMLTKKDTPFSTGVVLYLSVGDNSTAKLHCRIVG